MELAADETVIYEGRPSWRSILGYYILGVLAAAVAGVLAAGVSKIAEDEIKAGWVAIAAGGVLLVVLIVGYLRRLATHYLITTRRLRIRHGILSRQVEETRVERIQDTFTRQSILERLLRVGTVDFDTASEGQERLAFRGVSNPAGVARAVDEASHQAGLR
jgi:uncharacterized membrane protein YdbT with pleckstrin-like domain